MADEKIKQANIVYRTLCKALDEREWKYAEHPEDLVITFTYTGEDIPMEFVMAFDADSQSGRMLSRLPRRIPSH